MKKIIFCICFLCTAFMFVQAESEYGNVTGIAFDYALTGRQNDFALSAAVSSPWFFHNLVAMHVNADLFFPNAIRKKPYYSLDIALMGGTLMKTANIRLYGGGGPVFIFPAEANKGTVRVNGQGFFGFEFFMDKKPAGFSIFTEMGGGGLGFTAKAGFRYTLAMLPRR